MRRRSTLKYFFGLGVAGLAAGALPSCATNDSMMFIIGVYARKQGACTPKPDLDSPILAKGTLDLAFASEYRAALLIGNQITNRGVREKLRTETSRVILKGAEVQLETPQGASLASAFSATGTGFVDASEGTDPSLAVVYASLIPASLSGTLPAGTVIAKVRVFGTTLGGADVESAELSFPIEICAGCLVSYPASARDLTAGGTDYTCKVAETSMASASADADLPCELGIDLQTPCTTCSGTYDLCLSPSNNPYFQKP